MAIGANSVSAGPTKEFFVSMITRDIQLPDAIVELIDNSIDGIKRQKVEKYDDFFINVTFNKNKFQIEDNCGGIDSEAMKHAFMFGKPKAAREKEERLETTGTFGIGMKRALFKMGQNFEIRSIAKNSSFLLRVDVPKWIDDDSDNDWNFPLIELNDSIDNDITKCGTTITVSNLFPAIAQSFEYAPFISEVIKIVQRRVNDELANGLIITVNETRIEGAFLSIINGGNVFPYKFTFESNNVKVMILAGISNETDPDKAGWFIYCNNREVLAADKSSLTTWRDDKDIDGVKYHNDYATFRGFVFFTSSYPELLPWNTSKTGVDSSSSIYKETKQKMIDAFKVVSSELKLLSKLDEEIRTVVTQEVRSNPQLNVHYYAASGIPNRTSVSFVEFYKQKVLRSASSTPMSNITYQVEKDTLNKVKKALGVKTNGDVGKKTFEYFVDMEEI